MRTNVVKEFLTNPAQQKFLIDALDLLAEIATASACQKGFHEDEERLIESALNDSWLADKDLAWLNSAILQAELARQMSEIAEAVEAVRQPGPDHHLPEFSNFIIEEADAIIRVMDTVGKRRMPIGEAVVAKMLFNINRPHKHGKES